jgi:hypothetical protein
MKTTYLPVVTGRFQLKSIYRNLLTAVVKLDDHVLLPGFSGLQNRSEGYAFSLKLVVPFLERNADFLVMVICTNKTGD